MSRFEIRTEASKEPWILSDIGKVDLSSTFPLFGWTPCRIGHGDIKSALQKVEARTKTAILARILSLFQSGSSSSRDDRARAMALSHLKSSERLQPDQSVL